MKSGRLLTLAAACAASALCAAQIDVPDGPADIYQDIQLADDPATAAYAYERGASGGADRLALNRVYMYRMIELGLPGQAEQAAEELLEDDPFDGVAWAVLAYCDAARNDTIAGLAQVVMAVERAPNDPFVLGVAGKLMAWYRYPGLGDQVTLPPELARRLDEIHAQLGGDQHYMAAFAAAFEYYASQAAAPIPEQPEPVYAGGYVQAAYDPAVCTTYNDYVYAGFTVPCYSVAYVVPRVRACVLVERRSYRHVRFHIRDRHRCYARPVVLHRPFYERTTCRAVYHPRYRARVAPPRGVTLAAPKPRYVRVAAAPRPLPTRLAPTRPPTLARVPLDRRLRADGDTGRFSDPRGGLAPTSRGRSAPRDIGRVPGDWDGRRRVERDGRRAGDWDAPRGATRDARRDRGRDAWREPMLDGRARERREALMPTPDGRPRSLGQRPGGSEPLAAPSSRAARPFNVPPTQRGEPPFGGPSTRRSERPFAAPSSPRVERPGATAPSPRLDRPPESSRRAQPVPRPLQRDDFAPRPAPRAEPMPGPSPRAEPVPRQGPRSESIPVPRTQPVPRPMQRQDFAPRPAPRAEPVPRRIPRSEAARPPAQQARPMPSAPPRAQPTSPAAPRPQPAPPATRRAQPAPSSVPRAQPMPRGAPEFRGPPRSAARPQGPPAQMPDRSRIQPGRGGRAR